MRKWLPFAIALLSLSSIGAAKAADPVLLAESGAFLLGNAQRCGVSTERVMRAGRVVHDMIASVSREAKEKDLADARFSDVFWSAAAPAGGWEVLVPPCDVVVTQFNRLENHHRQAGFTE
jgi:hypothetical protein